MVKNLLVFSIFEFLSNEDIAWSGAMATGMEFYWKVETSQTCIVKWT